MKGKECPRCSEIETWDYMMKCVKTKAVRRKHIIILAVALLKEKEEFINSKGMFDK